MFDIDEYIRDFVLIPVPAARELWAAEYESNIVHSEGVYPEKRIGARRPYEPVEVHEFRKANYSPITKDAYQRAMNDLTRVLNQGGVSINMPPEIREYLGLQVFDGTDYWTFSSEQIIRRMIEDPNGRFAWFPQARPEDTSQAVSVSPYLVLSSDIHHVSSEYFTWLSAEKSMVKVGNKEVAEGTVHYILTKMQAWKRLQVGKKSENKFEWELVYNHNLGYIPAFSLPGEPTTKTVRNVKYRFRESYFAGARAWLDDAIAQYDDHKGTVITCSFPIREMASIPCPNTVNGCTNGKIYDLETAGTGEDRSKTCGICGGRGTIAPSSPYGVILRNDDMLSPDKKDIPAMRFITPDVGIVEYGGKHAEFLLAKGEKALDLLFIENAQSAVAKDIDREGRDSKIDRVGLNYWLGVFKPSVEALYGFLYPARKADISVTLPQTFRIRTESELIKELQALRDSKTSVFMITEVIREIVGKRYPGNVPMQRKLELLISWDPLFGNDKADVENMLASGGISDLDHARNIYGYAVVDRMYRQNPEKLLTGDIDALIADAEAILATMVPKEKPVIGKNGLPE